MLLELDRSGPPAHAQIEEQLAELIAGGALAPGERLPPERDLAAELGVSRMTLRHALSSLVRRGLVTRAVGRSGGTFVAEPKVERALGALGGLSDQLRRQGRVAGATVSSATEKPAGPATAAALGLAPGERVHEVVRVRFADGEPLALERSSFPAHRFPGLLELPLDGSLYELLAERYGDAPRRAVERLEPVLAGREDAGALGVDEGAPLMLVERTAYGAAGVPLEFAHDRFRGDRTRIVAWASEMTP